MAPNTRELLGQEVTAETHVVKIFAWRREFNALHLIDLGLRLGLFRTLAERPGLTARGLAEQLGLHPPYVERWCTTAYGFELLEVNAAGSFCLAPFLDDILANPQHPRYLGGYVQLGTEFATEDSRRGVEAFRSGCTLPFQERSEAFVRVVADSTRGLQVLMARKILPELPGLAQRLSQGGLILEVGCGVGNLLTHLAKGFPHSRCVGINIDPIGLAAACMAVQAAGVAERVEIQTGSVENAVSPNTCDAIVMVEVLHEVAPGLRPGVIQGCARALRPGGWLVILDETYPATLEETRQPAFRFALQTGFEELLWGNVIPTRAEQERLLPETGFTGDIGAPSSGRALLFSRPSEHEGLSTLGTGEKAGLSSTQSP